jgi:hypothetical protein
VICFGPLVNLWGSVKTLDRESEIITWAHILLTNSPHLRTWSDDSCFETGDRSRKVENAMETLSSHTKMHLSPSIPTRSQVTVQRTDPINEMITTNTSKRNANSTVLRFMIPAHIHSNASKHKSW